MKLLQLAFCFSCMCSISYSVSESAMEDIEKANEGGIYDQVDMRLTEEQRASFHSSKSNKRNKRAIYDLVHRKRWPKAAVPFTISSNLEDLEKTKIYEAIRKIESVSCVRFKEYPVGSAPNDHVTIYKGPTCWSYIGRTGGHQDLSLNLGCIQVHIIIHELLHALGFFHEQSRQDRDQYVKVNRQNIQEGYESNFDISGESNKDGYGVKYDSQSIMHYGNYQFAKSTSEPTIVLKTNPKQPLGGRKLTPSDILQLNLYYECEGIAKSTPTTTTRPTTSTTTTTRPTTTTTTTARPTTTTTTTTRPTTTTTTTTRPTTTTTTTTRPKTTTTTTTRPTTTTTTTKRPKTTTTASRLLTTTTTTRQKTATRAATKKITGTISTAQPSTFGNKKTPIARSTLKPVIRSTKVCGDETYLCSRALVNRMICTFPKFCRRSCGLCSGPSENMCDLLVDAINVGCESSTRKEHCVSKDKRERRRMKQECPKTCCMRGKFYE